MPAGTRLRPLLLVLCCLHLLPLGARAALPVSGILRAWQPLERQEREPDTLFLLDAEQERQLVPGLGGLIEGRGQDPERWKRVAVAPGKYRPGLRSLDRDYGYLWMPSTGLIDAREFTVEFWVAC